MICYNLHIYIYIILFIITPVRLRVIYFTLRTLVKPSNHSFIHDRGSVIILYCIFDGGARVCSSRQRHKQRLSATSTAALPPDDDDDATGGGIQGSEESGDEEGLWKHRVGNSRCCGPPGGAVAGADDAEQPWDDSRGTGKRGGGADSEAHPLGRRIGRARAFPWHTAAAAGSSPLPTRLRRCLQARPAPPPRPSARPRPSVRPTVSSARTAEHRSRRRPASQPRVCFPPSFAAGLVQPQTPTDRRTRARSPPRRPGPDHAAVAPAVTTTSRRHEMQLAARRIRWMCLLCACALADQHVNVANNDTQTGSASGIVCPARDGSTVSVGRVVPRGPSVLLPNPSPSPPLRPFVPVAAAPQSMMRAWRVNANRFVPVPSIATRRLHGVRAGRARYGYTHVALYTAPVSSTPVRVHAACGVETLHARQGNYSCEFRALVTTRVSSFYTTVLAVVCRTTVSRNSFPRSGGATRVYVLPHA